MQMLYDSENFVVVAHSHVEDESESQSASNCGYELVDKRTNMTMYLQDSWAKVFYEQILSWRETTPEQSEVEGLLDQYTSMATVPLTMH